MRRKNKKHSDGALLEKKILRLQHFLNIRDHGQVLKLATDLKRHHPNHPLPWKALAISCHAAGDLEKALKHWGQAMLLDPAAADTHSNMGAIFRSLGKLEEAEKYCFTAVELAPDHPELHLNLGIVQQQLAEYGKAESSYKAAAQLKPCYFEALFNLGLLMECQDRFLDAKQYYELALAANPQHPASCYQLANTFNKLNQPREAIKHFQRAISLHPGYIEARNNLGVTLQNLGRWREATDCHLETIKTLGPHADVYFNLGLCLEEMQELKEAARYYCKALDKDKDSFKAQNNLGLVLIKLNEHNSAVQYFKNAISIKPEIAEPHLNLALAFYAQGDLESALASVGKACALDPSHLFSSLVQKILILKKAQRTKENVRKVDAGDKLDVPDEYLLLERPVAGGLVDLVCTLQSRNMDDAVDTPVFGNGSCSLGYNFFEETNPAIQTLKSDMVRLLSETFESEIFIYDSFFNIYNDGSGIPQHDHLTDMDKLAHLELAERKFSLVYYLDVGDQTGDEPGRLILLDPPAEILPSNGMITLFRAGRKHSASYHGKRRRVVIGVNFYVL